MMSRAAMLARVVAIATATDVIGDLAFALQLDDRPERVIRRLDKRATFADADRQYAELMRAHDALFGARHEKDAA
jgi:hypothetical protein